MQLIIFCIIYPFLWIISILPWRIFYLLSTILYQFLYYIIGYRKKQVTENLTLVFPNKPMDEIIKIRKAFYKHLCDMFMEMIKSLTISEKEITERFKVIDRESLLDLENKKKSIIVLMGHYASYEWTMAIKAASDFPLVAIYKKIKNPYFDKLAHRIRKKFDARLIPSNLVIREIINDVKQEKLYTYGFLSDQSPKLNKANFWTSFMGIRVPVFTGGVDLACKFDLSVAYLKVNKVKRGYYEASFVPITTDAKNAKPEEITKTYLSMLEEQIKSKPAFYLWTHKRWKHRNKEIPKGANIL